MEKLWTPPASRPKYECGLCGQLFYRNEEDAYGKHMGECSERNEDVMMEQRSTRHQMRDVLAVGDHELDAWVKKNRQAVIEGRKRM